MPLNTKREPCPACGCPGEKYDGHVCEDYEARSAALAHLRAVLADNGNCDEDEPQDSSCPRCKARAFLAVLDGKTPRVTP